jgi:hypothetical protein
VAIPTFLIACADSTGKDWQVLLFWLVPLFALDLAGLSLGGLAWILARRDLARMRRGLVDLEGEPGTTYARVAGATGGGMSLATFIVGALSATIGAYHHFLAK